MSEQQFFPFVPSGMDWEAWNGNLVMYYSEEPIPYNTEVDWRITAKNVSQLPTFAAYPVPDPDLFQNWQDWAYEFTLIINGKTT